MSMKTSSIGIIGGAGSQGSGLALRWAASGHDVLIGSRDGQRGREAAERLSTRSPAARLSGGSNVDAAAQDIVVISVPYPAKAATLEEVAHLLAGKVVIDLTVPLVPPRVARVSLPAEGCGAKATRGLLPDSTRLVAAFQNVSAEHLADLDHAVDCDVLICSDDVEARSVVVSLAADAGMRGIEAGTLDNAAAADALTSVLIWINKRYGVKGAGLRITGIPRTEP